MTIRETGEDAYFAASNSKGGFFSYYPQCFDAARVKQVFAVKGGPGTGKSYFLRRVAEAAERAGWQSEYIYCSSDPDSLDGVILTGAENCVALLDATAPHVYEPKTPGLREEIINLGAFWKRDKLLPHAETVACLNAEKSAAYRQAYRFLASVGAMTETRDELVAPFVRRAAIERCAERLLEGIPNGSAYHARPALIASVGMRGEVAFDTYFRSAERLFLIEDLRGVGGYLLDAIGRRCVEKRLAVRLSHDPIEPERLDGIFLCDSKQAFVIDRGGEWGENCRRLSMRRFLDRAPMRRIKPRLTYLERMRRALLGGAVEALGRVREVHFAIEECYIAAMDFDAKEAFTKNFCSHLFDLQNS